MFGISYHTVSADSNNPPSCGSLPDYYIKKKKKKEKKKILLARMWEGNYQKMGSRPMWLEFRSSKWLIGWTAAVAAFTDGFIYSSVVPVLPFSLVERSGVSEDHVQFWLSTLLMVFGTTMTLGAPVAGWAADRSSSRKAVFLAGLGLALLATILYCLGRAPWVLVIARAIQGFSASIIYTAGLALIADTVSHDEVGSWMGFVLSGMNLGTLIGPFLAGIIYARLGYYAVFAVVLGVIAFDFSLRLLMIEKKTAAKWLFEGENENETRNENEVASTGTATTTSNSGSDASSATLRSEQADGEHFTSERPDETSTLLPRAAPPQEKKTSWFSHQFPAMAILLSSSRLRAAVYGCFTCATVTASFDAILPMFVKRTLHWDSAGAGLIFLALTVPSLFGTVIGGISDRYGARRVSLVGFALTTPSLVLLGLVHDNTLVDKILLPIILVSVGIGLNLILAPLAADMFYAVAILSEENADAFGKGGAYAQAYSLFDAALGLATFFGPAGGGFFLEQTNWQVTVGIVAVFCAVGSLPVWRYTGDRTGRGGGKVKGEDLGEEG